MANFEYENAANINLIAVMTSIIAYNFYHEATIIAFIAVCLVRIISPIMAYVYFKRSK